jgi:hypothetical protein
MGALRDPDTSVDTLQGADSEGFPMLQHEINEGFVRQVGRRRMTIE